MELLENYFLISPSISFFPAKTQALLHEIDYMQYDFSWLLLIRIIFITTSWSFLFFKYDAW